jgi:hypothetical protein
MNSQRLLILFLLSTVAIVLPSHPTFGGDTNSLTNAQSTAAQPKVASVSPPKINPAPMSASQMTRARLDHINIESLQFNSLPFEDALNQLRETAKARDPDHRGMNFLIEGASAEALKSVKVTINPPLSHLSLRDAIDSLARGADQHITYSIRDYGVVFRVGELTDMRVFRVDPNTFQQGLQGVGGVPFGNTSGNSSSGNSSGSQSTGVLVPRVDFTRGVSGATSPASN